MKNNTRVPCLGKCGRTVFKDQGECRKCRRKRVHAGKKRLVSLRKQVVYQQKNAKEQA